MERKKLSPEEILFNLAEMEDWKVEDNILSKRFEFADFAEALRFVNNVGTIAENHDHHPDISFGWGYAEINLTTHDRNGITAYDFAVANAINKL